MVYINIYMTSYLLRPTSFLCLISCLAAQELLHYRTVGGKVKECKLTLRWPKEMSFTACGRRRLEAETRAAALACLKLKVC